MDDVGQYGNGHPNQELQRNDRGDDDFNTIKFKYDFENKWKHVHVWSIVFTVQAVLYFNSYTY